MSDHPLTPDQKEECNDYGCANDDERRLQCSRPEGLFRFLQSVYERIVIGFNCVQFCRRKGKVEAAPQRSPKRDGAAGSNQIPLHSNAQVRRSSMSRNRSSHLLDVEDRWRISNRFWHGFKQWPKAGVTGEHHLPVVHRLYERRERPCQNTISMT